MQYPFPIPQQVVDEIKKVNKDVAAPALSWTPDDAKIPLSFTMIGIWEDMFREAIHSADERIQRLDPNSDHCRDMHRAVKLVDEFFGGLRKILLEGYLTLPFDPVARRLMTEHVELSDGLWQVSEESA